MSILIWLFKFHLRVIYFFLKLLPTNQKKIVLITRQSNTKSLDFILIEEEVAKNYPDYKVVSITKKLDKNLLSAISYYFNMYKQMYHLATSKTCLVDTYVIPVSILKHKKNLLIIQLNHGIGNIKKFAYQTLDKESGKGIKMAKLMNMHCNYDYVISTSEETSKFYAEAYNMDISKMINAGPPKIDYILNISSKKEEVLNKYPDIKSKPVILYVSTFRTYEDDYLDKLIENLPLDKYNVIMHLHPVIYSLHPELDEKINIEGIYRCKDIPTVDLLSVADYAITDFSSFIFESAILEIPTYLYVPDYDKYVEKNGLNVDLLKELPDYAFKDAKEMFKNIEKNKYDKKVLRSFREKYVANCEGNSTATLVKILIEGKG